MSVSHPLPDTPGGKSVFKTRAIDGFNVLANGCIEISKFTVWFFFSFLFTFTGMFLNHVNVIYKGKIPFTCKLYSDLI